MKRSKRWWSRLWVLFLLFGGQVQSAEHPIPADSKQVWDFRGKSDLNIEIAEYEKLFECKTYEELRDALIVAVPVLEKGSDLLELLKPAHDCRLALVRAHYLLGEIKQADTLLARYSKQRKLDPIAGIESTPAVRSSLEESYRIRRLRREAREHHKAKDRKCLPMYVELLKVDEFSVRWEALDALRRVTGQEFHYYASAKPEEREKPIRDWADWVKRKGQTAKLNWGD